jgi:hypothetical protein
MLLSGILRGLSCLQSTVITEAHSPIANPLPAKSTQTSKAAQEPKRRRQPPARPHLQKEQKPVRQTTAVSKSSSKKLKPVQTDKPPSSRGKTMPTPVSKTRQDVKSKTKPKL